MQNRIFKYDEQPFDMKICLFIIDFFLVQNLVHNRGWSQTNFVELWSVSRPRLIKMAIETWVMCQLTEKIFETSSV